MGFVFEICVVNCLHRILGGLGPRTGAHEDAILPLDDVKCVTGNPIEVVET